MSEIEIEHDGGDQLVYIPRGESPEPVYLSEPDRAIDMDELVNPRERAVLVALLKFALRKLDPNES